MSFYRISLFFHRYRSTTIVSICPSILLLLLSWLKALSFPISINWAYSINFFKWTYSMNTNNWSNVFRAHVFTTFYVNNYTSLSRLLRKPNATIPKSYRRNSWNKTTKLSYFYIFTSSVCVMKHSSLWEGQGQSVVFLFWSFSWMVFPIKIMPRFIIFFICTAFNLNYHQITDKYNSSLKNFNLH